MRVNDYYMCMYGVLYVRTLHEHTHVPDIVGGNCTIIHDDRSVLFLKRYVYTGKVLREDKNYMYRE